MSVTFKPASRQNVPLLIALEGASGSGKTFTALMLAAGIADEIGRANNRPGRVFAIDTEHGRMRHYAPAPGEVANPAAGTFAFEYAEIEPPFSPAAYGDAIKGAEQAGADVIIIDSFSHEWEGEGGVRDWAEMLEAGVPKVTNPRAYGQGWQDDWQVKPVKAPAQWIEPKKAHKRLVNQMLAARAHVIVCLRSEEKMRLETIEERGSNGKVYKKTNIIAAADLPVLERWVPICEKRFPYEITTSLLLLPSQPGVPVPRKLQEQHLSNVPTDRRIGRDTGAALARWAMGGAAANRTPPLEGGDSGEDFRGALDRLHDAASHGTAALQEAWRRSATAPHRAAIEADGTLAALKKTAAQHDPEETNGRGSQYDGA